MLSGISFLTNIAAYTGRLQRSAPVFLFLAMASLAHAQSYSRLSSRFLARGEQALLQLCITGSEPEASPRIPNVKDVTIQSAGFGPQLTFNGRKPEYAFPYYISSYEVGKHTIPALEVMVDGVKTKTEPIEFQVFDPNDLQWSEETVGGRRLPYSAMFFTMSKQPYEGETVPVEIKLYVPRQLAVEDWGIPEFQQDGVASWRYEPTDMKGQVMLLGSPYISVSYPSTLTATRTGTVGIGPASVRLITRQIVMDGFARPTSEPVFLKVPKLEMEARPLPEAPEGFENAVGNFSVQAITTDKEVHEGDPLSVDIVVSGQGNLDTLRAPKLLDASGWKAYDATTAQRGDERRQLDGTVNFRQFLRPLEMKSSVPPYRLVYFDPSEEIYKTVMTQALPLKMIPSTGPKVGAGATPPTALPVPVESMTDILGNLPVPRLLAPVEKSYPWWIGHVVAALLALALIGKALWIRTAHFFIRNPEREEKLHSLKTLAQSQDDAGFLKSAGNFIERYLGRTEQPEIQAILEERDAKCYRADKSAATLERSRRDEILRILKKAVLSCAMIAVLCLPQVKAKDLATTAQTSYDQAKYEEAIEQWLSAGKFEALSADTLYNIGNACYRIGSPGQAALYYRRALQREPHHSEAAQNLRFIERKYGSVTIPASDYQRYLSKAPLPVWKGTFWIGAWALVLSLLVFPATRPGASLRMAAVSGLVAAPVLLLIGGLGWRYFPDEARFAPLTAQAVVIADKASLYTDAARTSPIVTDTPQGSVCAILRQSGEWAYVAFSTKTRGWVPLQNIEKLIPDTRQGPPKVKKPKADPNNA